MTFVALSGLRDPPLLLGHEEPLDSMDDSVLLSCPPYLPAGRRFSVVKNTVEAQRSRRFTENTQRTKNHEVHNESQRPQVINKAAAK